jgi:hypothetical protein
MTREEIDNKAQEFEHTDGIFGFKEGVKFAQRTMYSEEAMFHFAEYCMSNKNPYNTPMVELLKKWVWSAEDYYNDVM